MEKKEVYWWIGIVMLIVAVLMLVFGVLHAPYLVRLSIVLGCLAAYLLTWKGR